MQHSSEFPGPSTDDYDNVHALNRAFLDVSTNYKGPQKGRLAEVPFLLFSLREDDLWWWQEALSDSPQRNLLQAPRLATDEIRALQSASIGFLWQLSQRNPYAARIITGATLAWCELLVQQALITLLERVGSRGDLMQSRLAASDSVGATFLSGGASSRKKLRRASHIVALQSMLTRNRDEPPTPLSAVACKLSIPAAGIATDGFRRVSEKKV
jgi:hypothetical protein